MRLFMSVAWILSLVIVGVILASAQSTVNFSGTWLLDKSKSDVAQLFSAAEQGANAHNASMLMVVEQQGTTIKVMRTLKSDGDEKQETHIYKTDGTETTNTGLRGDTVLTKALWEGQNLVFVSTRKLRRWGKEFSVNSRAVWSLSPDGKTLTIEAEVHSPRGDQRVHAVFDKQERR
jgi:hypothetical protein